MKSNISNNTKSADLRIGGAALAALLFVSVFMLLGMNLGTEGVKAFDQNVYEGIMGIRSDGMTFFMGILSFIGSSKSIASIIAALLLIWILKVKGDQGKVTVASLMPWLRIAGLTAVSALLNEILKVIWSRPRPEILRLGEAHGFSFPSGHSMTGMVFFGICALTLIWSERARFRYIYAALLVVLSISIGISRIYLGVHYPSDVAGGFAFGLFLLCGMYILTRKRRKLMIQE